MRNSSIIAITVTTALALAPLASGCGGPCHNVISAQREVRDMQIGGADGRPHVQLRLPHNRLNVLFERALEAEAITYEVPLSEALPLPVLSARAARVEVVSARDGNVGFNVDVELALAGIPVTRFGATIEARPETTTEGNNTYLEISFDADSLRAVRPVFPEGAVKAASKLVGQAVTKATGQKIPDLLLQSVTRRLMTVLSGEAFELIRDNLLVRVGEVARLRVDLGRAPIERADVHTSQSAQPTLVVDVFTRLPIKRGLPAWSGVDPISGTGQLRVAGAALAELGNWAMAEGLAPQTYDRSMQPDPNGAYVPVYAWRDGELPLVVHAYRIESPCSKMMIGARPAVKIVDGEVVVSIEDGKIEQVSGSTLMKLGVGLRDLFSGDITKSAAGASSARFLVGDRPVKASLLEAAVAGSELQFTVDLTL